MFLFWMYSSTEKFTIFHLVVTYINHTFFQRGMMIQQTTSAILKTKNARIVDQSSLLEFIMMRNLVRFMCHLAHTLMTCSALKMFLKRSEFYEI